MSSDLPAATPDAEPPRERRRGSRGAIIVGLAAVIIVALFGATFALRGRATAAPTGAYYVPGGTIPANWVQYTDPEGYFSLWMPPDWTATRSVGSGTQGDAQGSATFPVVSTRLGTASSDVSGIAVYITFEVFTSDLQRRWTCAANADPTNSFKTNTTLAGLPAYFGDYSMWLLDTENGHFQIDYRYPGSSYVNPGGPMIPANAPTATAVPVGVSQADQPIVNEVIASFTPNPDTALTCA